MQPGTLAFTAACSLSTLPIGCEISALGSKCVGSSIVQLVFLPKVRVLLKVPAMILFMIPQVSILTCTFFGYKNADPPPGQQKRGQGGGDQNNDFYHRCPRDVITGYSTLRAFRSHAYSSSRQLDFDDNYLFASVLSEVDEEKLYTTLSIKSDILRCEF